MSTELYLPLTLPYPVKIVSLDAIPQSSVARGTRLLSYSFVHVPSAPRSQPESRFGTWDSAVEGIVDAWKIKQGDVISDRQAREKPVVLVTEPCKHGVQVGGLCGLCGKDMTDYDYTGFSDTSRASIQMTHSAFGPTVSLEEAERIERETAQHLLKSRKLSLIVDLDQTIVHATVDPTVGEWISEGLAWEARQAKKASAAADDSDESDDTESESDGECNPNWDALRDVKKFRLGPESFGPQSLGGRLQGKGKNRLIENEGCMYYIKPRPGWKDFLHDMAAKYEMHVYTMGTRAYAEEVCAAIDPDSKIFGGRILSRDESGSLTQKNLQRLFPCDTSMVVIIDDRADVWEWSPNLIKVIPYDFFVGIGDINSTHLPKLDPLTGSVPPHPASAVSSFPFPSSAPPNRPLDTSLNATAPGSPEEKEQTELATKAMLTQNSLALEAQLEERPLARKQEALQGSSTETKPSEEPSQPPDASGASEPATNVTSVPVKMEKAPLKALLKNDDSELERIRKLLEEVHRRFFSAYDSRLTERHRRRSSISSKLRDPPRMSYDVTTIIPNLRSETLEGVHILFSSVIPLDTRPETTEIWRMAHMFGAQCSTEFTNDITHVVAAKRGTVKVDLARKRGGIKIVWLAWFTDCIALWRHQDETSYLLDDPPAAAQPGPSTDVGRVTTETVPDAGEWDEARKATGPPRPPSLELTDINWNDINDEVDAAMNESDDEDDRSERQSEDEDSADETNSVPSFNMPTGLNRKRLRSVTPSEGGGVNGDSKRQEDVLRSPLAKRKKLAADRTGYSKLKEAITAEELDGDHPPLVDSDDNEGNSVPPRSADEDEDEAEDEEDEEDDFLARELGEEWG